MSGVNGPRWGRDALHALAKQAGGAVALKARLVTYLASADGQAEIARGPLWWRDRDPAEIAHFISQDVDWKRIAQGV